ncbi:MAG: hypothetical protein JWL69_4929 [Phycisphaerales bacterium]|nr:hypothetical protein [Phycisphaerales bacterium]MDB5353974.1 hypothetical protein [Phycisphaerales bacterium]
MKLISGRPFSTSRRHGFTLIEATISLAIVSVMLVAAMSVAGQSARARLAQKEQVRGELLARQLLSEILQEAYQQPNATTLVLGPELLETRATYNDVDDFNGWSESPPQNASGTAIPGYTGWKRSVKVDWVTAANPTTVSLSETGLKRVIVTVTAPSGKVVTMTGLRSQNSLYDQGVSSQAIYTGWMGVTLQVGSDATTSASGGVNVMNQVP